MQHIKMNIQQEQRQNLFAAAPVSDCRRTRICIKQISGSSSYL